MSKEDEALKLAEDALKRVRTQDMELVQLSMIALAAIREALAEQPAQQNVVAWESDRGEIYYDKEDAFRYSDGFIRPLVYGDTPQAQPAQQQEPVRVPVADNTYNYAKSLAEAIFKQHFASDEHYSSGRIVWGVNDTVIGILTQIDNMVADMVRRPAQQEPVSDRENAIIRFALHQFMSNAYSHMNAAAQDKDSRHYTVGAVEKFAKDAKDAEALLSRLQFKAPQPAQRTWVGLTDEQWQSIADTLGCIITRGQKDAIEAKLREKNQ